MSYLPFVSRKERMRRLRICIYGLGVLAAICSFGDKIMTYLAIGSYGYVELNPYSAWLMSKIGLLPACVVGYIVSLIPILLIFYGIKHFKLGEKEHYLWLFVFILTVYFVLFFELLNGQLTAGF